VCLRCGRKFSYDRADIGCKVPRRKKGDPSETVVPGKPDKRFVGSRTEVGTAEIDVRLEEEAKAVAA
jgi:hypothetical protein